MLSSREGSQKLFKRNIQKRACDEHWEYEKKALDNLKTDDSDDDDIVIKIQKRMNF